VVGRDAVREYWQPQWAVMDSTAVPTAVTERPDDTIEVAVHLVARDHGGHHSATRTAGTCTTSAEFSCRA
jgi:hypothetical protein